MKIFYERELKDLLDEVQSRVASTIQNESANYLLNVNESDYVAHLVATSIIESLEIHFDDVMITGSEKMIAAERFPFNVHVVSGKKYPVQVITYSIPYSGDKQLFLCRPSTYGTSAPEVKVEPGFVCFDIINFSNEGAVIKREAEQIINKIKQQYQYLAADVKSFNARIEQDIRQMVASRKAVLLQQSSLLHSLGVPVRKSDDVPQSFAVPTVKKKLIVKPAASDKAFAPEPTLDNSGYEQILQVINEIGAQIEKHPAVYRGKDEEGLRDVFLVTLSPNFDSASGETFNKSGKTDILIRHEGKNIFVAECKIWKGAAQYGKAIDQLLSYLTWRESKAAIMCFVKNKMFSAILDEIEKVTAAHPCFIRQVLRDQSSLRFEFRLLDDPSRNVHLAVLCFHFV